jgi:carboxyl-terminal processing protease
MRITSGKHGSSINLGSSLQPGYIIFTWLMRMGIPIVISLRWLTAESKKKLKSSDFEPFDLYIRYLPVYLFVMKKKKIRNILAAFFTVFVLLSGSILFISSSNDDFKLVKSLEVYYSLFRELNLFYVDETNPEKLVENSINGMLKELDPYTTFIPESDRDNFNFMTTGEYGGIGSLIRRNGEFAIIAEPYEGFPSVKAGLRAGDTLLAIDGKSVQNLEITKISERLKGKPNTPVTLTIKRLGVKEPFDDSLIREKVTISNVPYYGMIGADAGYIRLSNFTTGAANETKKALLDLKKKNDIKSLVLDLRGNPGGLLIEAVDIANLFVPKEQEIVSTRGRVKQWDQVYTTRFAPVDTSIFVAVLVSRGSASASEIVAGALQDLDRGVILGQRTFGKGLVQTTRELSYNSKLKVTTAKYYIPSGRCIQALDYSKRNEDGSVGVIPDSLISAYLTRNGRTVYDGGGIQPDFPMEAQKLSQISVSLITQNLIFDFATLYASLNDSIPPLESFRLEEKDYYLFKEMVGSKDFEYQTQSEESLKKLVELAKREKYFELAKTEFLALESKLAHNNEKDLENFREEISQLIYEEIASRYYYQKGRVEATIQEDPEVKKAIEVLNQPGLYMSTLGFEQDAVHAVLDSRLP